MSAVENVVPPLIDKSRHSTVLVVDFGGQYSQLIVRRIRDMGVFAEMIAWQNANERLSSNRYAAVILSGGPQSVLDDNAPHFDVSLLEGTPTLGICYGLQFLAHSLGGEVQRSSHKEYGEQVLNRVLPDSLAASLDAPMIWMSHGDRVARAPYGFVVTASTTTCPIAAFEDRARKLYGVQFHPEVSHTTSGRLLLREFIFSRAGIEADWSSKSFVEEAIAEIRSRVGDAKVLCAISGGVDSSVMAALLTRAIGERAVCVFVNHGLLRKGEAEQVVTTFTEELHPQLVAIDAHDQFFDALKGVLDPEEKRKIIGAEFVRVFQQHADELSGCTYLAQGTLYPDVIESGSSTAAKIKTHHNVGGLPDWMKLQVIEPLRLLFKDEVRAVGRELGLASEVVDREPFPGPGLAVRIIGEVTPESVRIVQEADWIFRLELRAAGLHKTIWQSYAALLDVRSVGVMGDARTYERPIVLRAVESEDAMTARAARLPIEFLERVATRIVNEVEGVNRVVYDLSSKPPATIEWE